MKHTRQWNHSKVSNSMKKTNEKRILFTSVGRRVELVQAFKEAASRVGVEIRIHGADLLGTAPALSFCDVTHQVCRIDDLNYIPSLLKICKEQEIDLLIPTIDTDLRILSRSKELFDEINSRVLVSDESVIEISNDKRNTYKFFKKARVATPETFDDYTQYNLGFPCFIKPYAGSASKDAYSVPNQDILEKYAKDIPGYIVQNKIVGEEFTVDILCDFDGRPIYITPRRRLQVRAGEVLTTEIMNDPKVVLECRQILSELGAMGPLTVQYIKDSETGINHYIEINPRFGGGSPLSMKAGANSAESILRMLVGYDVEPQLEVYSPGAIYSRFDQSVRSNPNLHSISSLSELSELLVSYKTIIFDLDDTLYNEFDYVKSGFKAVAKLIPKIENAYDSLLAAFRAGKPAIDMVLNDAGIQDSSLKKRCLEAYRHNRPDIKLENEVKELLGTLRAEGKKLGIVTDGRPEGQRAKIEALGLSQLVDEIIITDELAGATGDVMNFRKPNDMAFIIMQRRLGAALRDMVYVADNPAKDFHAARSLGFDAVYFINPNGLYSKKISCPPMAATGPNIGKIS